MKFIHLAAVWFLVAAMGSIAFAGDTAAFFPVMVWNDVPGDPAVLKKMHDCGFTVAGFVSPSALDAVAAAGMKAIVNDPRVGGYDWTNVDAAVARKNVESLVAEVNNHPAVYGYYLRDEPTVSYFAGLEKVASVIREKAPGKWAYIDLFPNVATGEQLGAKDYPDYLEKFIATCHPPVLSYDHYALMDDGSVAGEYFQNLEQMRAAAKKASLPFWNIILGVATFNYAEPTFAGLRFQVYTTLAYGGRGISYFTYFAPSVGNYRLAAIDQFGNPSPTWYFMQNVNLQIQKLGPTLLKLTSDDVYHFGNVPTGTHGPDEKSLVSAAGGEVTVGDFTHADGSRWVMVVNQSLVKSLSCDVTFRKTPKRLMMVSPYSGELVPFEGEQRWLAAGQGVLLKLAD